MKDTDLILVVDLEATCWDANVPGTNRKQTVDDMEIIEFGCVVAQLDGTVIDAQSFLVRPVVHPVLSEFCTSLTSLTQQDVKAARTYTEAVQAIDNWLQSFDLSAWGSWGNYDKNQIRAESDRSGTHPDFFNLPHMNIKQVWRKSNGLSRKAKSGLTHALEFHKLAFDGRLHRGIDDARNITKLLVHLNQSEIEHALDSLQ